MVRHWREEACTSKAEITAGPGPHSSFPSGAHQSAGQEFAESNNEWRRRRRRRRRQHGYPSSYDVPFNYGRFARQTKPLTQMTLREIDELQTRILNHPENTLNASPVGRYQIVRSTLRDLKNSLRLNDNMIFDQNLQDRLGMARLEQAGLKDYVDRKISEQAFQRKLAGGWASVADPVTGRVRQGQHLGTTTAQIIPLIRALRKK